MSDFDFKSGKPVEEPRDPSRGLEGSDCRGAGRGLIGGYPSTILGGSGIYHHLS